MFETALVRKPYFGDQKIDAGLLAEVLLFYQNTHLVLDTSSLLSIIDAIGIDNLCRLLADKHMKASFVLHTLGTHTENVNGVATHKYVSFRLTPDRKNLSKDETIALALERRCGKSWGTRRDARKIAKLIPRENLDFEKGEPTNITEMAHQDLLDQSYSNPAILMTLEALVPSLTVPEDWNFRIVELEDGFGTLSNFDFDVINAEYHRFVSPKHSSISPAYLLSHLLDARADITFATKHTAELITSPLAFKTLELKFAILLGKRSSNAGQIDYFQNEHLDARSIRDAINSGEKDFSEFINLLDDARKFKDWLKNAHPEIGLAKEYFEAATAKTWVDKLPAKSFRFAFFTGAGLVTDLVAPTGLATTAGLALAAGDSFLLDNVLRGWRPNQFVDEKLSEFVK